jgi:hypothetical protein
MQLHLRLTQKFACHYLTCNSAILLVSTWQCIIFSTHPGALWPKYYDLNNVEYEALQHDRDSVDIIASIFVKSVGFSDTLCYCTLNYAASCLKWQPLKFFRMVEHIRHYSCSSLILSYLILHLCQVMRPNMLLHKLGIKVKVKVKLNFTLEQTTKAQRGIRGIALLFL